MFLASVGWVKTQQNIKVVWNNLQTTSKKKPDLFGTAATSCRKSNRKADIPISTPIQIPTNPWRRYATTPMPREKANRKSTTFTAIKLAFQEKWLMIKATWFRDYYGRSNLKSETNISGTAHKPFRLQNTLLHTGM